MTDHNSKPINPFHAALRRAGVRAELTVDDVLLRRPNWSEQMAKSFMDRHAAVIANAMLKAGTDVLGELLGHA